MDKLAAEKLKFKPLPVTTLFKKVDFCFYGQCRKSQFQIQNDLFHPPKYGTAASR